MSIADKILFNYLKETYSQDVYFPLEDKKFKFRQRKTKRLKKPIKIKY